jgi:hypothetical protein
MDALILNLKRFFLLFLFLPAVYLASGQMPGMPYGVLSLDCSAAPAQPGPISGNTTVRYGSRQTYSVPNVSGVTYTWSLPSGWSGSSTTNSINVTVGSSGGTGTISVTPVNPCGTGTKRTLNVIASNCSGYIIPNGVFTGPDPCTSCQDRDNFATLTGSRGFASTKTSLCVHSSDQSKSSNWANAGTLCKNLTTDGKSWRLPNIAELGNLQGSYSSYGIASNVYWSSTKGDASVWSWYYGGSYAYWYTNTNSLYVRCVRNL